MRKNFEPFLQQTSSSSVFMEYLQVKHLSWFELRTLTWSFQEFYCWTIVLLICVLRVIYLLSSAKLSSASAHDRLPWFTANNTTHWFNCEFIVALMIVKPRLHFPRQRVRDGPRDMLWSDSKCKGPCRCLNACFFVTAWIRPQRSHITMHQLRMWWTSNNYKRKDCSAVGACPQWRHLDLVPDF